MAAKKVVKAKAKPNNKPKVASKAKPAANVVKKLTKRAAPKSAKKAKGVAVSADADGPEGAAIL